MAVSVSQVTTDNTAPTMLCTVPSGVYCIAVANAGPGTALVGPPPAAQGAGLPGLHVFPGAAPTSWAGYTGSRGGTISVSAALNGSTVTVSYLLSTNA